MFEESYLRRKIKRLNEAVWERRVTGADIDAWLESFSPPMNGRPDERLHMLYLLSNFLYFGVREIRELLRSQYRCLVVHPIISKIRRANGDTTDLDLIDNELRLALSRTRFLAIGNPSESGQHLLYYFRQENRLPSQIFINHIELPGLPAACADNGVDHVDRYIFLDDLCGTGDQAIDFSQTVLAPCRAAHPGAEIAYYPLFATAAAMQRIAHESDFTDSACLMELDDSFKCFSATSRIYADANLASEKAVAESIARNYGSVLAPRHPLGYKDSQLAVGFSHNTPDNTLPIFWSEASAVLPHWSPVFQRYHKI